MSGWAFTADDRNPGNYRLAIALLGAGAFHVAVILGVDLPSREQAHSGSVLEFNLLTAPAQQTENARSGSDTADSLPSTTRADEVRSATAPAPGIGVDADLPDAIAAPARPLSPEISTRAADDSVTLRQIPALDVREQLDQPAGFRALPYAELAKEIATSELRREQEPSAGAGHSRTRRLSSTSIKTVAEAAYLDMWRQKVERIGRANYPAGGLSGELSLLAVIRYDGTLEEARILESSGHPALDETALRIVRLAAPYAHFPTELHKSCDRLEIVRSWRFARAGALVN